MSSTHDPRRIAQAIVAAHSARFAGHPPAPFEGFSSDAPVYRGAREACATLGFIDIDSECVARAWQAQTARMGRFDAQHWPDAPQDFGLGTFPPASRPHAFVPCPEALGLYAVLPDAAWVGRMARAGLPTVQLRFKSDDPQAIGREIRAAVEAVRCTGALLFINDHWRQALDAGAYGVHLGQEDLDALTPAEVRTLQSSGARLGVSTHGYAEMVRADAVAPSYLALGAVFPTTLKKMATAAQGLARLHDYTRLMRGYPLVAIGGIDQERLPQARAAGVGSIAVVRAIVGAPDPEGAARQLAEQMRA